MSDLASNCNAVVAEMGRLGATFEITNSGLHGEPRWTWSPAPGCRDDIRRYWACVDRCRMGFQNAMVEAIRRVQRAAA